MKDLKNKIIQQLALLTPNQMGDIKKRSLEELGLAARAPYARALNVLKARESRSWRIRRVLLKPVVQIARGISSVLSSISYFIRDSACKKLDSFTWEYRRKYTIELVEIEDKLVEKKVVKTNV